MNFRLVYPGTCMTLLLAYVNRWLNNFLFAKFLAFFVFGIKFSAAIQYADCVTPRFVKNGSQNLEKSERLNVILGIRGLKEHHIESLNVTNMRLDG